MARSRDFVKTFLYCFFGPQLYHVYRLGNTPGHEYEANILEKTGDAAIKWFRFCSDFFKWTSPMWIGYMYHRGFFTRTGLNTLMTYGTSLSVVLVISVSIRAAGRWMNSEYVEFLSVLIEATREMNPENKRSLSLYDFDFHAWPVEFIAKRIQPMVQLPEAEQDVGVFDKIKGLPSQIASYVAINTFGRRFMYPGTTALMQTLVSQVLLQGRIKLIEEHKAIRHKLKTEDGNEIAAIVVDRRNNTDFPHGGTLVICCEGNAGFYEIGCMITPLEAGYSTLGWNHPGFTGSTGEPFPSQEQHAIDTVVQFAVKHLGFELCDIILFGWSIGGYPVTWAAMNYPQVKGVVLDATFDDITPLAVARMPQSWASFVRQTIKNYMNLRNAEQLCRYPGPVLIIRRSRDEMITTIDPTVKSSNRGNFLLMKLLAHRYPNIMKEDTLPVLTDWLSKDSTGQVGVWSQYEVDSEWCTSILRSYVENHSTGYPLLVGENLPLEARKQLVLFLASKYMIEFDATHCQPLPATHFREPTLVELPN